MLTNNKTNALDVADKWIHPYDDEDLQLSSGNSDRLQLNLKLLGSDPSIENTRIRLDKPAWDTRNLKCIDHDDVIKTFEKKGIS